MLLTIGLSNALMATGMALVVAVLHRYWRRPAVIHSLWILVLLKLITPPLLTIPVPQFVPSWPALTHVDPDPPATEGETAPTGRLAVAPRQPLSDPDEPVLAVLEAIGTPMQIAEGSPASAIPEMEAFPPSDFPPAWASEPKAEAAAFPWATCLFGIWLTGTLSCFVLVAHRVRRFRPLISSAGVVSSEIRAQVERLAKQLGLANRPETAIIPGRVPPLLWALGGKPKLFLPAALWQELNGEQQAALIAHELAHLKRGDHWVRYLELLITALYWWHPVVWWACRKLREAEEECCDAWVVWALPATASAYAAALVATVDFLCETRPALPVAASGISQVGDLRRRLIMIMQGKTPRSLSGTGLVAVLGLAALLLPLVPSWAQETSRESQAIKEKASDTNDLASQALLRAIQDATAKEGERLGQALFALTAQQPDRPTEPDQGRGGAELDRARAELNQAQAQMRASEEQLRQMEHQMREASRRFEEARRKMEEQRHRVAERIAQVEDRQHRGMGHGEGAGSGSARHRPDTAAPDQDRRISEIERKLDEVMDELRQLRREMRPPGRSRERGPEGGRRGAEGGAQGSGGRRGARGEEPPAPPDEPGEVAPVVAPAAPVNPAPRAIAVPAVPQKPAAPPASPAPDTPPPARR